MQIFSDRSDAGRQLAAALSVGSLSDPVIIALPRGGVPVACEVARALNAPLEVQLVRKLGAPGQPEFALGAIADGAPPFIELDEASVTSSGANARYVEQEIFRQREELRRRRALYGACVRTGTLAGRTAVLIDDGIATGATVRAAAMAIRQRRPDEVVLAVPVAAADAIAELRPRVDRIICLQTPAEFRSVGDYYADFSQVQDETVLKLLGEFDDDESPANR